MLVLYGATGYTGRLIASELARSGDPFVVAGRDEAKLGALVDSLGSVHPSAKIDMRVATPKDPSTLEDLVRDASAVASAAGPFGAIGMPLVAACAAAGVPYCDTTGEPDFVRSVGDRFPDTPAPLVPAAGFDYVPHGLAAALAARSLDSVERVDTALMVRNFTPTRGTTLSTLGVAAGDLRVFVDGAWAEEPVAAHRRTFTFPAPAGVTDAVSYPGGDASPVARQTGASTVRTWLCVPSAAARLARPAARLGPFLLGAGPVRRALEGLVARSAEGPSPERRAKSSFGVLAEAVAHDGSVARALATGTDVYRTTAALTAQIVRRLAGEGRSLPGGYRAPAEVVGNPVVFAAECGIDLSTVV
jgi:short subunit dehydrogenase-like uncharacterized protein